MDEECMVGKCEYKLLTNKKQLYKATRQKKNADGKILAKIRQNEQCRVTGKCVTYHHYPPIVILSSWAVLWRHTTSVREVRLELVVVAEALAASGTCAVVTGASGGHRCCDGYGSARWSAEAPQPPPHVPDSGSPSRRVIS